MADGGDGSGSGGESVVSKEYYFLQTLVGSMNAECLEVKKWSVGAASAVAVAGQVTGTPAGTQALVIAALAFAFWLTEAQSRLTQWCFIRRIQELEYTNADGPQVSHSWYRYYNGQVAMDRARELLRPKWQNPVGEKNRLWDHFWKPITLLPHIVITILALGVFIATEAKWLEIKTGDKPQKSDISGTVTVHLDHAAGAPGTAPVGSPR